MEFLTNHMPSSIYSNTEVKNIDTEYNKNKRGDFGDSFTHDEELLVTVDGKARQILCDFFYLGIYFLSSN